MFRKSTPQSSFFEVDHYIPGALAQDDWCYTYQKRILPLINEDNFKHLFSVDRGRPNSSIKTALSLIIFIGTEQQSWRGGEYQFPRRLDWMIATNTPFGKATIDHTTLFKFYQRLETDDTAYKLFVELTSAFMQACGTSLKKQRTDSFYIHGWLRILSRFGLFKETIRKFLQALHKQKPGLYEKIKDQLSQNYLENKFDLTEKDRDLAQKKISLMAKDLYYLVTVFENHKQVQHYETFKVLCQVFSQQCEVKNSAEANPEIVLKEKPDKDAVCTPHNTENKTQFITDVNVVAANCHDAKEQPHIQDRLIENEFKPEKQYKDAGFVNGQTIIDSKAKGIDLEGPTSGRSQSFEAYEKKDRPFDAGDFDTTLDDETNELFVNKCPNNQEPSDQRRSEKTGKMIMHFDRNVCSMCPDSNRCPVKIGKRTATYTVDEAEYVGAVRHHHYMTNSAYRKECAVRAGAEALVSELTRAHGMRKSRHRKQSRTNLQLIFAALACNVKRFIRHGQQYAYLEPEPA